MVVRRGLFSAALFSSRYNDMQVSQVGLANVILANASKARIDGAEFEVSLRPVRALTLNAGLGLMDRQRVKMWLRDVYREVDDVGI